MEFQPSLIRSAREAADLTQQELADAAGLRLEKVQRAESGKRMPSAQTLGALAHALQIEPGAFYSHAPDASEAANGHGREVATDPEPTPSTELARTAGMGSK